MFQLDDRDIRESAEALLVPLRAGKGLDEKALLALKSALSEAARKWRGSGVVLKSTANLFIDLAHGMESCGLLYRTPERERILQAADEVADLVRAVVS